MSIINIAKGIMKLEAKQIMEDFGVAVQGKTHENLSDALPKLKEIQNYSKATLLHKLVENGMPEALSKTGGSEHPVEVARKAIEGKPQKEQLETLLAVVLGVVMQGQVLQGKDEQKAYFITGSTIMLIIPLLIAAIEG